MILRLVAASIRQRPGRSLLLLLGYALGVGVTIALLSIGGALLAQSRDRDLIGGGDVTVLPGGIDLETLRTGGVSSMFFTIDQARFAYRETLASPRFADRVVAAAPWMEDELLYLELDGERIAASAAATIPSLAEAVGVPPAIVEGAWRDVPADREWMAPTTGELYRSLDALHLPPPEAAGDSTWAEWHYFNVLRSDGGWLYLTFMIAGDIGGGRWGGRLIATLVDPSLADRSFSADVEASEVSFREGEPELSLADSRVEIDADGVYHVVAEIPAEDGSSPLAVDLEIVAASRSYLPPLDIGAGTIPSGYTVPILNGRAEGKICVGARCERLSDARAYHDHNWGVWRDVTWDWGQAVLDDYAVLYGGIRTGGLEGSRFLYVVDRQGFAGVFPIREIRTDWGAGEDPAPEAITVLAIRGRDTLSLTVEVAHVRTTDVPVGVGDEVLFHQMRGRATLLGRLRDHEARARGEGFFETWSSPTDAGSVSRSGR